MSEETQPHAGHENSSNENMIETPELTDEQKKHLKDMKEETVSFVEFAEELERLELQRVETNWHQTMYDVDEVLDKLYLIADARNQGGINKSQTDEGVLYTYPVNGMTIMVFDTGDVVWIGLPFETSNTKDVGEVIGDAWKIIEHLVYPKTTETKTTY